MVNQFNQRNNLCFFPFFFENRILKGGAAFYNFDSDAVKLMSHIVSHVGCSVILTDRHNVQVGKAF